MSSTYHKDNIYRVMRWEVDNLGEFYDRDKKFNELARYFKMYFKAKEKETINKRESKQD